MFEKFVFNILISAAAIHPIFTFCERTQYLIHKVNWRISSYHQQSVDGVNLSKYVNTKLNRMPCEFVFTIF